MADDRDSEVDAILADIRRGPSDPEVDAILADIRRGQTHPSLDQQLSSMERARQEDVKAAEGRLASRPQGVGFLGSAARGFADAALVDPSHLVKGGREIRDEQLVYPDKYPLSYGAGSVAGSVLGGVALKGLGKIGTLGGFALGALPGAQRDDIPQAIAGGAIGATGSKLPKTVAAGGAMLGAATALDPSVPPGHRIAAAFGGTQDARSTVGPSLVRYGTNRDLKKLGAVEKEASSDSLKLLRKLSEEAQRKRLGTDLASAGVQRDRASIDARRALQDQQSVVLDARRRERETRRGEGEQSTQTRMAESQTRLGADLQIGALREKALDLRRKRDALAEQTAEAKRLGANAEAVKRAEANLAAIEGEQANLAASMAGKIGQMHQEAQTRTSNEIQSFISQGREAEIDPSILDLHRRLFDKHASRSPAVLAEVEAYLADPSAWKSAWMKKHGAEIRSKKYDAIAEVENAKARLNDPPPPPTPEEQIDAAIASNADVLGDISLQSERFRNLARDRHVQSSGRTTLRRIGAAGEIDAQQAEIEALRRANQDVGLSSKEQLTDIREERLGGPSPEDEAAAKARIDQAVRNSMEIHKFDPESPAQQRRVIDLAGLTTEQQADKPSFLRRALPAIGAAAGAGLGAFSGSPAVSAGAAAAGAQAGQGVASNKEPAGFGRLLARDPTGESFVDPSGVVASYVNPEHARVMVRRVSDALAKNPALAERYARVRTLLTIPALYEAFAAKDPELARAVEGAK